MPNPRDQRLQQLAALMQMYNGMQQAQGQSQQNALGQAQLQQTGQWHQGELAQALAALNQQGQWHQGELGNQQSQLAELSRYHSGELQNQQNAQALAGRQGDAQLAELAKYHQGEIEARKAEGTNRTNQEFMQHFLPDPNIPWEQKLAALQTIAPQFGPMGKAMHESGVNSMVQKRLPEIQGMYGQYNQGHDMKKFQEGMNALYPSMPQEVFDKMPWDQLNQGMWGGASQDPQTWGEQMNIGQNGRTRGGQEIRDYFVNPTRDALFAQRAKENALGIGQFVNDIIGDQPSGVGGALFGDMFRPGPTQEEIAAQKLKQYNLGKMLLK